jgi:hypothetical protein
VPRRVALRKSYQWVNESARGCVPYLFKPWSGLWCFDSSAAAASFVLLGPSFVVGALEAVLGVTDGVDLSRQLGMEIARQLLVRGRPQLSSRVNHISFRVVHDRVWAGNAGVNMLL